MCFSSCLALKGAAGLAARGLKRILNLAGGEHGSRHGSLGLDTFRVSLCFLQFFFGTANLPLQQVLAHVVIHHHVSQLPSGSAVGLVVFQFHRTTFFKIPVQLNGRTVRATGIVSQSLRVVSNINRIEPHALLFRGFGSFRFRYRNGLRSNLDHVGFGEGLPLVSLIGNVKILRGRLEDGTRSSPGKSARRCSVEGLDALEKLLIAKRLVHRVVQIIVVIVVFVFTQVEAFLAVCFIKGMRCHIFFFAQHRGGDRGSSHGMNIISARMIGFDHGFRHGTGYDINRLELSSVGAVCCVVLGVIVCNKKSHGVESLFTTTLNL
mmetsp:Transcript_7574/g.21033  ORF Transcript_7574/g.21033 Transcript_7574/m.21033 type:complete len:321 (+) Transcript_7574:243-1205(+)